MTVYPNYSGNYNGFRHIIADNNNPVNSCQTRKLKKYVIRRKNKRIKSRARSTTKAVGSLA